MTIYHLVLLLILSAILSIKLRAKSSKAINNFQMLLGFVFVIATIIVGSAPNKIGKNIILPKHHNINLISKDIPGRYLWNKQPQEKRLINQLSFDENNILNFEYNWINWNIGGICSVGIDLHKHLLNQEGINPLVKAITASTNPRLDIEYCRAESTNISWDRYLVALNNDSTIMWKHSLVKRSQYSSKTLKVIGTSIDWVILYNDNTNEITILSSIDGKVIYPFNNVPQIEFENINLATYDANNKILYTATKNKYNEIKNNKLVKNDLESGMREILHTFPRELARFPYQSAIPIVVEKLIFMPEYNLLSIFSQSGASGNFNDVFQIYDLNIMAIIFKTEYQKYLRPIMAINNKGTSVGISYRKNDEIRVLDQYNISLKD